MSLHFGSPVNMPLGGVLQGQLPFADTSLQGYLAQRIFGRQAPIGGTSSSSGGSGTVTSVALTLPSIFAVSGSPITTSGTLAGSLVTQAANLVFGGPSSGSAAAPTFRSLVAADLPSSGVTAGSYTNSSITVNAQGQVTAASSGQNYPSNVLINGGFDFAQRQAPASATSIGNGSYGPDRWRSEYGASTLTYTRNDNSGSPASGHNSRFSGTYTKGTSSGKIAVYQIIEGVNCEPLQGRTVTVQGKLKASSSATYHIGLVQLNSSGTMDTIASTIVSAFNAGGTDPTLATNYAYIAPSSVPSGANGTAGTNGVTCSVTTAWQNFAGVFSVPANCRNLIVIVWSDATLAAADTVTLAEFGLFDGLALQPWLPRSTAQEMLLCKRYYEKSHAIDTKPGTSGADLQLLTVVGSNGSYGTFWNFTVEKRATPTVVCYDSSGNANKISRYVSGVGWGSGNVDVTVRQTGGFVQTLDSAEACSFSYTADTDL